MAGYFGKRAICARMGWGSATTLDRHIKVLAFPCYPRIQPPHCLQARLYTNDELISRWEWVRAQLYREQLLEREQEREARKAEAARQPGRRR